MHDVNSQPCGHETLHDMFYLLHAPPAGCVMNAGSTAPGALTCNEVWPAGGRFGRGSAAVLERAGGGCGRGAARRSRAAPVPSLPPLGCQEAVPVAPKGCTPKLLAVPLSQLPAHAPQACAACQPRGHADGRPDTMHVCMLCIACVFTLRFACLCSFLLGGFQSTVMFPVLLSSDCKSSASHLLWC